MCDSIYYFNIDTFTETEIYQENGEWLTIGMAFLGESSKIDFGDDLRILNVPIEQ